MRDPEEEHLCEGIHLKEPVYLPLCPPAEDLLHYLLIHDSQRGRGGGRGALLFQSHLLTCKRYQNNL